MQRFFYLNNLAEQLMLLFYVFARSGGSVDKLKTRNTSKLKFMIH